MKRLVLVPCALILAAATPACGDSEGGDPTSSSSSTGGSGAAGGATGGGGTAGMGGDGGTGGDPVDDPPGPVANLSVAETMNPYGAEIAFDPPSDADIQRFIIVRSDQPIDDQTPPADGTAYNVGDTLPNGAEVVMATTMTTVLDKDVPLEATSHYGVYAVDYATQYSTLEQDQLSVAFPVQLGTIVIDDPTTNPTVSVTLQPPHMLLSGSATHNAGTVTLTVAIANEAHRHVFNPKLLITGSNDNNAVFDADLSMPGGEQALYFGTAFDVGAVRQAQLTISNITANPVTLGVRFEQHPAIVHTGGFPGFSFPHVRIYDTSGGVDDSGFGATTFAEFDNIGFDSGFGFQFAGSFNTCAMAPDDRSILCGSRNRPVITRVDLTTLQATNSADLSAPPGQLGSSSGATVSPDGAFVYMLVNEGGHTRHFGPGHSSVGNADLVKLDAATLMEAGRVTLVSNGPLPSSRSVHGEPALTSDGATAVVPLFGQSQVAIVDTAAMTVTQTVASNDTYPVRAAIDPTDSFAIVAYGRPSAVEDTYDQIDLANFAVTTFPAVVGAVIPGDGHGRLAFGPDGKLYSARTYTSSSEFGLSIIDFPNTTGPNILLGNDATGLVFDPDGLHFWFLDHSLDQFIKRPLANPGTPVLTVNMPNVQNGGHTNLITPF